MWPIILTGIVCFVVGVFAGGRLTVWHLKTRIEEKLHGE